MLLNAGSVSGSPTPPATTHQNNRGSRTAAGHSGPVDLLIEGIRIRPHAGAELVPGPLAIREGRIVAIGPDAAGMRCERRIRVDGAVAVPGFVDSHTHVGWAGAALWRVSWRGVAPDCLLPELARAARLVHRPHWILGGGWDREALPESALPSQQALDRITGSTPCLLTSADGQLAMCNSAAAELMRLADLPPVPGGEVVTGADGRPTGVLRGAAARAQPTAGVVPPIGRLRSAAEIADALQLLAGRGVTEIHDIATWPTDPGTETTYLERSFTDVTLLADIAAAGRLPVRVGVRPFLGRWAEFAREVPDTGHRLISFTGLKLFVGGHGYHADDGSEILASPSFRDPGPATAAEWVVQAHRAGIGCSLHAIGDGDVQAALDVFQRALLGGGSEGVPHRIVHLRSVRPQDIRRIARMGLAAEVQPFDVLQDADRLMANLGPAGIARLAPYRELADAGVPLLLGSDWRDAHDLRAADPLVAMATGVLRRIPGDDGPPLPGRGLTPAQALYAAGTAGARAAAGARAGTGGASAGTGGASTAARTTAGAKAGAGVGGSDSSQRGEPAPGEPDRGVLGVGRLADFAVLSDDPLSCDPAGWPTLERLLTVCDGRISHQASGVGE